MLGTLDRMNTKHQSIYIAVEDWETLKQIAANAGIPVNRYVNQILEAAALAEGHEWAGLPQHGGWRGGSKVASELDNDES